MKTLDFTLRFHTPAFLGNAEQSGQWRTPPIKALLRQWWRMVYAADHKFDIDVAAMRREEGWLFGVASDGGGDSRKSLVRIRLDKWAEGQLKKNQWPGFATVSHPEVPMPVASDLYLGYGPLVFRNGTALKSNAAIQFGESATLSLAVPTTHKDAELRRLLEDNVPRIERALWLMDRYGTLGGRSRNGWGSCALLPSPAGRGAGGEGKAPLRPWRDCLNLDWPHAIGQDEKGPLIWQTAPHDDWKALMKTLAIVKIGLRTQKPQFEFTLDAASGDKPTKNGINHGRAQARHWLSYPVTNHSVQPWDAEFVNGKKKPLNLRLPNTLRFKVRPTPDGKLVGVIFHVPHLPPAAFNPNRSAIERVWKQVHAFLDAPAQALTRIPE